ncbi:MAG: hypothetical protein BLITH_0779 [Brockia lithotrophica]|uniref:Uncharacterized protein n=1 Tax=Brockia lithotrophica TaxID=933949 RepID=A0A2T5G8U2_9BACL|nr:MAG: hypothetical protein BLITH_0779 [Brockia lithotrophica]
MDLVAAVYYVAVLPMNELSERRARESEARTSAEPTEEGKLLREALAELRKS